jgi:vancomycin aglycone glucosyltransferase
MVALGLALQAQNHRARLCAPPDFREFVEGYGLSFVPVGPEVRHAGARRSTDGRPSPEALRQLLTDTIAGQFTAIGNATTDCDAIVATTALQYAACSIAEKRGIPYYFAAYCPTVFPSSHHAPPPMPGEVSNASADTRALWDLQAQRWNGMFGSDINEQRAAIGLSPVTDVRRYMFTDRPLLAADPMLAPWPTPSDLLVTQTGAWILPDGRPLSAELESFLAAGEPPIYFGFGSVHTAKETANAAINAARAVGRRAILLSGWADLALADTGADCMLIGETNLQALFRRVAAIVHHGGSGTTTLAAQSGTPQVIVPHMYDQHYFANRVGTLGIGFAHAPAVPTEDSLTEALKHVLQPKIASHAKSFSVGVNADGAKTTAEFISR